MWSSRHEAGRKLKRRIAVFCAAIMAAICILVVESVIKQALKHGTKHRPWLASLLNRRPTKVAAIALANKLARMAWAMMAKGESYKEPVALAR